MGCVGTRILESVLLLAASVSGLVFLKLNQEHGRAGLDGPAPLGDAVLAGRDRTYLLADLTHDGSPYSKLDRIVEGLFLDPSHYSIGLQCADFVCAITAAAERGGGQARAYLRTLLPRFATHPATGEIEGVGIKRFPERARRPREEKRLF